MLRKGESVRRRVTGSILEMPTIFKRAHCATDLYTDVFGQKEGTMWCSGARDTMQEQSGETQCRTLPGRRTVRRWGCKCWARRRGQKKGQILEGSGRATRVAETFEKTQIILSNHKQRTLSSTFWSFRFKFWGIASLSVHRKVNLA